MENSDGLHSVQPVQSAWQGALVGTMPADVQTSIAWLDGIVARLDARRDISLILASLDPESREELLKEVLAQERAGQPLPPFTSVMADANFWADLASPGELKAYALACFTRLSPEDRDAFLDLIFGRAAA